MRRILICALLAVALPGCGALQREGQFVYVEGSDGEVPWGNLVSEDDGLKLADKWQNRRKLNEIRQRLDILENHSRHHEHLIRNLQLTEELRDAAAKNAAAAE